MITMMKKIVGLIKDTIYFQGGNDDYDEEDDGADERNCQTSAV